ncbi:hypothetical protein [Soonwooa sp.]|uniref:hypothetical protein n=2 Tax=Soonwooa sp. TaxID=1938592 RepID=UPI0028AE3B9E|nr:hypothetical protein [Soonwooa sp.]
MTFEQDFKDALANIPDKEKDKLILRLLKKDIILAKRLQYELLSEESVEDKRNQLQEILDKKIESAIKHFKSPGYLSMDVRYMSGMITEHVKITKDKFGDIWLNLYMLTKLVPNLEEQLAYFSRRQGEKFYIPALARIFKILMAIVKLHEDDQYEFRENLQILGNSIGDNDHFMMTAMHHGLDVNWLTKNNIPEDIADIHKEIKNNGFLKLS